MSQKLSSFSFNERFFCLEVVFSLRNLTSIAEVHTVVCFDDCDDFVTSLGELNYLYVLYNHGGKLTIKV